MRYCVYNNVQRLNVFIVCNKKKTATHTRNFALCLLQETIKNRTGRHLTQEGLEGNKNNVFQVIGVSDKARRKMQIVKHLFR